MKTRHRASRLFLAALIAAAMVTMAAPAPAMMGFGGMGPGGGTGWHQAYDGFTVDTSNDIFVNHARFEEATGHMLAWLDENGDGVVDFAQDNEWFHGLGIGPFMDDNGDGIHDGFQTHEFYRLMGMMNFVDVDGDGLSDNYERDPFGLHGPGNNLGGHMMQQFYGGFEVDTSGDLFVNPDRFEEITGHMMAWVDGDGDGIVDFAQNNNWFHGLGIGPFMDDNGDGIHDGFETYEFYGMVGMMNFVDINGDGLSDNYTANPTPFGGTMMGDLAAPY